MTHHLHSGHVHFAAREVPALAADCQAWQATLDLAEGQRVLEKIGGNIKLPKMPKEIIALEHEMNKPNPNLTHMMQLIESNAVISGEILRTVRSPAFQRMLVRQVEIHSLNQCVALIGIRRTYELALAAAMTNMATDNPFISTMLEHAAKTAYACAEIAGYLPPHDPKITQESAYLFGLYLHSGMLTLSTHFPNNFHKVFEKSLNLPEEMHSKELEKGVSHAALGVVMGQYWGLQTDLPLDRDMLLAIAYHHHPKKHCIGQQRVRLLIAIGLLAQALVSDLVYQVYQSQALLDQSLLAIKLLGLSDEAVSNIRKNLTHDWFDGERIATEQ